MTVNIQLETDIDLNIRKIEELISKLELLEDKSKMINFIGIREFANLRNCSIKTAQDIFNLDSFPCESIAKQKVISVEALKQWYMTKRDKKRELPDCSKDSIK